MPIIRVDFKKLTQERAAREAGERNKENPLRETLEQQGVQLSTELQLLQEKHQRALKKTQRKIAILLALATAAVGIGGAALKTVFEIHAAVTQEIEQDSTRFLEEMDLLAPAATDSVPDLR